MTRKATKTSERDIFDSVYEATRVEEVTPSEHPDFLVKAKGEDKQFGVEITELFLSGTNARLERMSGYVTDLLAGSDFKHKADAAALKVQKMDLISPDGETKAKQIPMIMQPMAPVESVAETAAALISKKSAIFDKVEGLTHINLIIADRSRRLSRIKSEDFYPTLFTKVVRDAVAQAPFREIFFLTHLEGQLGFIPLKMLQLMSEPFFFVEGSKALGLTPLLPERRPFIEVFAAYFYKAVSPQVRYAASEEDGEVIYGDTGIMLTEKLEPIVRMHMDLALPADCRVPAQDLRDIFDDAFIARIDVFRETNTFKTSLWFPFRASRPAAAPPRCARSNDGTETVETLDNHTRNG